jgi:hypothetical protein
LFGDVDGTTQSVTDHSWFDSLTKISGKHTIKTGFTAHRYKKSENQAANNVGTFNFATTPTPAGTSTFQQAWANFLLGIRRALAVGVKAYLTKDVLHKELQKAIRAVHAGKTYMPAALAAIQQHSPHLSAREIEVLRLIVDGLPNKLIAHRLNLAEATAKNHVKNILSPGFFIQRRIAS